MSKKTSERRAETAFQAECQRIMKLQDEAKAARVPDPDIEAAMRTLDSLAGPVEMFELELMSRVCAKSWELGSGFELYELGVATLARSERMKLAAVMGPVVSVTEDGETCKSAELKRRKNCFRRVAAELECVDVADAFLMSADEWKSRHVMPMPAVAPPTRLARAQPASHRRSM